MYMYITNLITQKCWDIEYFMYVEAGYQINPYALSYPVCVAEDEIFNKRGITSLHSPQARTLIAKKFSDSESGIAYLDDYEPCAENYLTTYLNRPDVQEAIHANVGTEWDVCSDPVWYQWDLESFYERQMQYYTELLHGEYDLNMLVFSGDDDSVCATTGTQFWIYDLGVEVNEDHWWDNWHVDGQTAGYFAQFELDTSSSFVFATVHGAGHEVPAYKPKEAYDLWERFLTQNWDVGENRRSHFDASAKDKLLKKSENKEEITVA